jgi:polysaccharide pyruvyl transferase WcaK-like protein
LWGTFDVANLGDMLIPRITLGELVRRLPQASVRTFGPYGYLRPTPWDAGEPAEPLGAWTSDRAAEMAEQLDCVVVGGGEIIHTRDALLAPHYGVVPAEVEARRPSRFFIDGLGAELERDVPFLWSAVGIPFDFTPEEADRICQVVSSRPYVAVRDELSRRRLEAVGVERDIAVVPDSGLLMRRLFAPSVLEKRLEYLRLMEWYPPQGRALVVQGNRALVPFAPQLAEAILRVVEERGDRALGKERQELSIVLAETGPIHGDTEFADALAGRLPAPVYRLPAAAGVEDIVAAIGHSAGFIGASLHGNIAALVHDRPHVALNLGRQSKLEGFAGLIRNPDCLVGSVEQVPGAFARVAAMGSRRGLVAALQDRVDTHFDRIAEIAEEAVSGRSAPNGRLQASANGHLADLEARLEALMRAHEVRGRRLVAERLAFADHVQELRDVQWAEMESERGRLGQEIEDLKLEIQALKHEVAGKEAWLQAIFRTKTFRWSGPFRAMYGKLRRNREEA